MRSNSSNNTANAQRRQLPLFDFTFVDLDQGSGNKRAERVEAWSFAEYYVMDDNDLQVLQMQGTRMSFESTEYGTGGDNPMDPMAMSEQQMRRAVTITYANTACFNVMLGVTGHQNQYGRKILFAGIYNTSATQQ